MTDVWNRVEEIRSMRSRSYDLVTPTSIRFLCCPGRMFGQSLKRVGQFFSSTLLVFLFIDTFWNCYSLKPDGQNQSGIYFTIVEQQKCEYIHCTFLIKYTTIWIW